MFNENLDEYTLEELNQLIREFVPILEKAVQLGGIIKLRVMPFDESIYSFWGDENTTWMEELADYMRERKEDEQ